MRTPLTTAAIRIGSILVEKCASGIRIGTVHGNHRPGEVERADIGDLHQALGRFIRETSEPSYTAHLAGRPHTRTITCDHEGCASRIVLEHAGDDVSDGGVDGALRCLGWAVTKHEGDGARDRHHCPGCQHR